MASVKDLGKGKYRVFVCNGFKPDGKVNRVSKVITAKSAKDAERQAQALEVDFKRGNIEPAKPLNTKKTFKELVEKWRELKEGELSAQTKVRYEGILKDFMLKQFGERLVTEITPLEIEEYLNSLKQDGVRIDKKQGGYSQKTIKHHFMLLSRIFNLGEKWDFIEKNPCEKIEKPVVDEKEASFYEPEQIRKMLECLEQEGAELEADISRSRKYKYYYTGEQTEISKLIRRVGYLMHKAYIWIALTSACRRSEVLGLEEDDLDYTNNCIRICRTSHYTQERGIYWKDKLKNGAPSKTISMPVEVMNLIKEYQGELKQLRDVMGKNWGESKRLFVALEGGSVAQPGTAIHPDNISQWFDRFIESHNLPKITLHQIRHTSISYLLNNNIDIESVAERAGHRDSSVTSRIYGHVFSKNKREGADVFSGLFQKAGDGE